MPQITHTEGTPNPNALKYITDTTLVGQGALSYESAIDAEGQPVASGVFALGHVNSVYIQDNFVAVNAQPQADWTAIRKSLDESLPSFESVEIAEMADAQPRTGEGAGKEDELLAKINGTIDKFVRPALAGDGGGLEVVAIEGTTVMIRYQGACGGCQSAVTGTLVAIENLLRDQVDEALTVQTV